MIQGKKKQINMLLQNPRGSWAEIRGSRENPDMPAEINDQITRSSRFAGHKTPPQSSAEWLFQVKYYDFNPQYWAVITDDKLFLEPYHMASTQTIKSRYERLFPDEDNCCGGRVPVLVFEKNSSMYLAIRDYFDWMFEHADPLFDQFGEDFRISDFIPDASEVTSHGDSS